MNDIINKFLLPGDNFKPKLHLIQPGFTFSACESFAKKKKKVIQEIEDIFIKMN